MTQVDWEQVWTVFDQAVRLPPDRRQAFVREACAGEPARERAVHGMLAVDAEAGTVLDHPAVVFDRGGRDGSPTGSAEGDRRDERRSDTGQQPHTIGRYRILRQIGQGGMSTVYLAVRADDAFRREVVVKVVRRDRERGAILRRLRAERQILAGLEHPYIARLYDGGTTADGLPYFVMEHVDGQPIDDYCAHNALTVDQRLALFLEACTAVQYAHQNLVVHRDLKPSNLLVTAAGVPKLLDFGIAKVLAPNWATDAEPTATWDRMLTPSYASPEQIRGGPITTGSDVYALGVMLYQLLTGRLPHDFSGRSPIEIERLLTETEPLRPSAAISSTTAAGRPTTGPATEATADDLERLRRIVAGDLDAIVMKALRGAPAQRYQSVEQLTAELERYRRGLPVEARKGNWRYRAAKLVRRHRPAFTTAAAILLLLAATAVALAYQARRIALERDAARLERDQKSQVVDLLEDLVAVAEPYGRDGPETTIRQILLRSEPALRRRLHDQPALRAQLLHTTGSMLLRLSALADAERQLEEALQLRQSIYGPRHAEVAATMQKLALVAKARGDYEQAETLARQAVAIIRGDPDRDSEHGTQMLTSSLITLAAVLCDGQAFDAAQAPVEEALALLAASGTASDAQRMKVLEFEASIHTRYGRYPAAAAALRQSLVLRRELYGADHPSQQQTLNKLAIALRWTGELEAAEQIYHEALEVIRATYGPDHLSLAMVLNNLGAVRLARGDPAGSIEAYAEARDLLLATVGPEHWRVFFVEVRMAGARIHAGEPAAAEESLKRGIAAWRPRLGDDHWLLAFADSLRGEALAAQGRDDEAETLLVDGFERLLEQKAKYRYQREALDRWIAFLESRGRDDEVASYEARLPAPADDGADGLS